MKNLNEQSNTEFAGLCAAVVTLGVAMAYVFNGMADWVVGL
ncbi:hypothetical protein [Vibrio phage BUCT006]|nr:hypothetical protein [Vibrio phage BUCT006]